MAQRRTWIVWLIVCTALTAFNLLTTLVLGYTLGNNAIIAALPVYMLLGVIVGYRTNSWLRSKQAPEKERA